MLSVLKMSVLFANTPVAEREHQSQTERESNENRQVRARVNDTLGNVDLLLFSGQI